jgi:hypothetical protein
MTISQVAQAACDKLSFTDAATLALAKKFCARRYALVWDACLWNDTLAVLSQAVTAQSELVTLGDPVSSTYSSTPASCLLDFPVAVRFTVDGDTNGSDLAAADWQSFFQLDPNTWNNVESRRATPSNFINMPRAIDTSLFGQSGVPQVKLVPVPDQDGTLFILGKQQSRIRQLGEDAAITEDLPFSIRGVDNALLAFTEGDLLEYSRQYAKAQAKFGEANSHVTVMKDMERNQQQQISRIIPDDDGHYTVNDIL